MRTRLVAAALAGTLGLAGAALLVPGSALAQTADGTPRVTALKDALKGLVDDGTITQSQADEVATTLADRLPERGRHGGPGGRGGPGGKLAHVAQEEVAEVLGITVDELRAAREAGRTLAQVAEAEGVEKADLISGLVAKAQERLDRAVADGDLTQERADEVAATLTERTTELVDRAPRERRGPGHGAEPAPSPSPTS